MKQPTRVRFFLQEGGLAGLWAALAIMAFWTMLSLTKALPDIFRTIPILVGIPPCSALAAFLLRVPLARALSRRISDAAIFGFFTLAFAYVIYIACLVVIFTIALLGGWLFTNHGLAGLTPGRVLVSILGWAGITATISIAGFFYAGWVVIFIGPLAGVHMRNKFLRQMVNDESP